MSTAQFLQARTASCVCGSRQFVVGIDVVGLSATITLPTDRAAEGQDLTDVRAPDPGQVVFAYCLGCGRDMPESADVTTAVRQAVTARLQG